MEKIYTSIGKWIRMNKRTCVDFLPFFWTSLPPPFTAFSILYASFIVALFRRRGFGTAINAPLVNNKTIALVSVLKSTR